MSKQNKEWIPREPECFCGRPVVGSIVTATSVCADQYELSLEKGSKGSILVCNHHYVRADKLLPCTILNRDSVDLEDFTSSMVDLLSKRLRGIYE